MKVLVLILVFHGRKYTDAPKGIVIDPIWMTFVTLNDFDELNINLNCDDHLNSLRNNNLPHPECPKKLTCFIIILTALISIILFSFNIFQDISKLQLSASPPPPLPLLFHVVDSFQCQRSLYAFSNLPIQRDIISTWIRSVFYVTVNDVASSYILLPLFKFKTSCIVMLISQTTM